MEVFDDYTAVWSQVQPFMKAKLTLIRSGLAERIPNRLGEIYEGGDEESRLSLDLYSDSLCIVSLDFTLLDATVNDEKLSGYGISRSITGYAALALGGYMPKAYTPDAFTDDVSEIVDRIEALDTDAFVRHVCDEVLTQHGCAPRLPGALLRPEIRGGEMSKRARKGNSGKAGTRALPTAAQTARSMRSPPLERDSASGSAMRSMKA